MGNNKSTEELVAEREALKKRLDAIRELNEVKKQRDQLEKEVRDLHRATSTKWKIAGKLGSLGKKYGKEAGKFFVEETRNFISEHDWGTCKKHPKYNGEGTPIVNCETCRNIYEARKKDEKEQGESLL
jgi:ribosomal protein L37AE/L43A